MAVGDLGDQLLDSRDQWLFPPPPQYPTVSSISPGVAPGGRRGGSLAKNVAKVVRHAAISATFFFEGRACALGPESAQGRRAVPHFGDSNGQDGDEEEKKLPQIAQPELNPLPDTFYSAVLTICI